MWSRPPLYSFSHTVRNKHMLETLVWVAYFYFNPLLTLCILVQFNWYICSTQLLSSVNILVQNSIFRHYYIVAKSIYYLRHDCPLSLPIRLSVRLSASITATLTGRISMKFDIWNLCQNLSIKSKFINKGKIIEHFTWIPRYALFLEAPLNCHQSSFFEQRGIRLFV
jgi:hypothetical protein